MPPSVWNDRYCGVIMRRMLACIALLSLPACATLTAERTQNIQVITTPAGARCTLSNQAGIWNSTTTPESVTVRRHFSPLLVSCEKTNFGSGTATLDPQTRSRAYGNILLFGVPAIVDAETGAGYEYMPESVTIHLRKK